MGDSVILPKVMRLSEVGGGCSCGIVRSLGKRDLSKAMWDFLEALRDHLRLAGCKFRVGLDRQDCVFLQS